jgi:hypothetical protein
MHGGAGVHHSLEHKTTAARRSRRDDDLRVALDRLIADEKRDEDVRRRAQWLLWGLEGRDVVAEAMVRWLAECQRRERP